MIPNITGVRSCLLLGDYSAGNPCKQEAFLVTEPWEAEIAALAMPYLRHDTHTFALGNTM